MKSFFLALFSVVTAMSGSHHSHINSQAVKKPNTVHHINLMVSAIFKFSDLSLGPFEINSFGPLQVESPGAPYISGSIVTCPGTFYLNYQPLPLVMSSFDPATNTASNIYYQDGFYLYYEVTGTYYASLGMYYVDIQWQTEL